MIVPVFFCLCAALLVVRPPCAAEEPARDASGSPGTLSFSDPRLKSAGSDWLVLQAPAKFAFIRTMFFFYGLPEEMYDVQRAVELMDLMYLSRRDKLVQNRTPEEARKAIADDALFNAPCHVNFIYILNDRESSFGVLYFLKKGAVLPGAAPVLLPEALGDVGGPDGTPQAAPLRQDPDAV